MARTRLTQLQQNFSKTTDANGWTVYDYGNWKEYRKRITWSQSIGGLVAVTISSGNLPSGMSSIGTNFVSYTNIINTNAGILLIVFEGTSASTGLGFTAARTDGAAAIAQSGIIDISITTP
ncbi:MAG: hypothetical protein QFB87_04540 [Patescibacteria group bacterium]|nr:hypothetical protein [Patescibacteria group bacterium]